MAHDLRKAILKGRVEEVRKLIALGVDVNKTVLGETALHTAARTSEPNAVKILQILLHNGADIEAKNFSFMVPLFLAAAHSDAVFLEKLIEWGNIDWRKKSSVHPSIFCWIVTNRNNGPDMVDMLMRKDVHCLQELSERTVTGMTPFYGTFNYMRQQTCKNFACFWEVGGNINNWDVNGQTISFSTVNCDTSEKRVCPLRNTAFALKQLGCELDDTLKDILFRHEMANDLSFYSNAIFDELEVLKKKYATPSTTWYRFLIMKRHEAMALCRNEQLQDTLNSGNLQIEFPIFGRIILAKGLKKK